MPAADVLHGREFCCTSANSKAAARFVRAAVAKTRQIRWLSDDRDQALAAWMIQAGYRAKQAQGVRVLWAEINL